MTKVCICENCKGLSREDGTPVLKCRCTTVEAIENRTESLAQAVFDEVGQEGFDEMIAVARCGQSETLYVGCGWWTIEIAPCGNDGNCAGCPSHYYSTTGEVWEDGIYWESVADAWSEFEKILGREATKDERMWLLQKIDDCKPAEEE